MAGVSGLFFSKEKFFINLDNGCEEHLKKLLVKLLFYSCIQHVKSDQSINFIQQSIPLELFQKNYNELVQKDRDEFLKIVQGKGEFEVKTAQLARNRWEQLLSNTSEVLVKINEKTDEVFKEAVSWFFYRAAFFILQSDCKISEKILHRALRCFSEEDEMGNASLEILHKTSFSKEELLQFLKNFVLSRWSSRRSSPARIEERYASRHILEGTIKLITEFSLEDFLNQFSKEFEKNKALEVFDQLGQSLTLEQKNRLLKSFFTANFQKAVSFALKNKIHYLNDFSFYETISGNCADWFLLRMNARFQMLRNHEDRRDLTEYWQKLLQDVVHKLENLEEENCLNINSNISGSLVSRNQLFLERQELDRMIEEVIDLKKPDLVYESTINFLVKNKEVRLVSKLSKNNPGLEKLIFDSCLKYFYMNDEKEYIKHLDRIKKVNISDADQWIGWALSKKWHDVAEELLYKVQIENLSDFFQLFMLFFKVYFEKFRLFLGL